MAGVIEPGRPRGCSGRRDCGPRRNRPTPACAPRCARAAARASARQWRDPAIGRVDDQPRAAVLRVVVFEPVQRAAQLPALPIGLDARLVEPIVEPRELRRVDVGERAAGERVGALHRNQAFVAVRVGALQIRVAPGCAGRLVGTAGFGGSGRAAPAIARGPARRRVTGQHNQRRPCKCARTHVDLQPAPISLWPLASSL